MNNAWTFQIPNTKLMTFILCSRGCENPTNIAEWSFADKTMSKKSNTENFDGEKPDWEKPDFWEEKPSRCTESKMRTARKYCQFLKDFSTFNNCLCSVDSSKYYENCVFDEVTYFSSQDVFFTKTASSISLNFFLKALGYTWYKTILICTKKLGVTFSCSPRQNVCNGNFIAYIKEKICKSLLYFSIYLTSSLSNLICR